MQKCHKLRVLKAKHVIIVAATTITGGNAPTTGTARTNGHPIGTQRRSLMRTNKEVLEAHITTAECNNHQITREEETIIYCIIDHRDLLLDRGTNIEHPQGRSIYKDIHVTDNLRRERAIFIGVVIHLTTSMIGEHHP